MIFKTAIIIAEFISAPIMLQIIAEDFADYSIKEFGIEPVVTRILEVVEGESGVHQDYRAIDFRNEHGGIKLYQPNQVAELVDYINSRYPRVDDYDTIIHHSFDDGPEHFHIQLPYAVNVLRRKNHGN